ncbi:MAG: RNA polymerase sigma factor, partial [Planctomycetota bacterium]|nr:RNA polymerase sigma factor [Planctomycetota bacterium]
MNAVTDEALMIQLAGGQEEALGELLNRYWALAYRYARTLTRGDPGAADDVAQESFLQIYLKSSTYSPGLPFRPWFFRILQNSARERFRGEKRRQARERRAARSELTVGVDPVATNEEWSIVEEQLGSLPDELRETIQLRFLEGFPLKTIAELSNCPEGTISSRIRRGLELLRDRIKPRLSLSALALSVFIESQVSADISPCPDFSELIQSAKGQRAVRSGASLSVVFSALLLGLVFVFASQLLSPDPRPVDPAFVKMKQGKNRPSGTNRLAALGAANRGAYQGSRGTSASPDGDPWGEQKQREAGPSRRAGVTKGFALRGQLKLAGEPMTGVTVCLRRNDSQLIDPPVDRFTAALDREGRFQFDELPGKAEFWSLDFRHDAYGQNLYYRLDGKSAFSLSTKLDPMDLHYLTIEPELIPVRVTGVVRDVSSKKPVPMATVGLWRQSVMTDRDGRYSLLAARSINLFHDFVVARAKGRNTVARVLYVEQENRLKKNDWKNIDFELGRGQVLNGRVVDEFGRPQIGYVVETKNWIPNQGGPLSEGVNITDLGWSWSAETDSDGRFQLIGIEENDRGSFTIWDKERYSEIHRDFGPKIGEETIEVVVKHSEELWQCQVVDPEGNGIANAHVLWLPLKKWLGKRFRPTIEGEGMVVKEDFQSILSHIQSSRFPGVNSSNFFHSSTNELGTFSLTVPDGQGWLLVMAPGYAS